MTGLELGKDPGKFTYGLFGNITNEMMNDSRISKFIRALDRSLLTRCISYGKIPPFEVEETAEKIVISSNTKSSLLRTKIYVVFYKGRYDKDFYEIIKYSNINGEKIHKSYNKICDNYENCAYTLAMEIVNSVDFEIHYERPSYSCTRARMIMDIIKDNLPKHIECYTYAELKTVTNELIREAENKYLRNIDDYTFNRTHTLEYDLDNFHLKILVRDESADIYQVNEEPWEILEPSKYSEFISVITKYLTPTLIKCMKKNRKSEWSGIVTYFMEHLVR